MKIPELTPTDLTKNIISLLIVLAFLYLTLLDETISATLEVAFIAVMAAYGIAVARPVVSGVLAKMYGRPQDAKADKVP